MGLVAQESSHIPEILSYPIQFMTENNHDPHIVSSSSCFNSIFCSQNMMAFYIPFRPPLSIYNFVVMTNFWKEYANGRGPKLLDLKTFCCCCCRFYSLNAKIVWLLARHKTPSYHHPLWSKCIHPHKPIIWSLCYY